MPLYISSHLTQCCASVYTYGAHYVFLLWTTSSPWENHPGVWKTKILHVSKKPSYSSYKINCFVLFYFVLFISHPSSNQSRNFTGTDEGMKVSVMNLPEVSQILPLHSGPLPKLSSFSGPCLSRGMIPSMSPGFFLPGNDVPTVLSIQSTSVCKEAPCPHQV